MGQFAGQHFPGARFHMMFLISWSHTNAVQSTFSHDCYPQPAWPRLFPRSSKYLKDRSAPRVNNVLGSDLLITKVLLTEYPFWSRNVTYGAPSGSLLDWPNTSDAKRGPPTRSLLIQKRYVHPDPFPVGTLSLTVSNAFWIRRDSVGAPRFASEVLGQSRRDPDGAQSVTFLDQKFGTQFCISCF